MIAIVCLWLVVVSCCTLFGGVPYLCVLYIHNIIVDTDLYYIFATESRDVCLSQSNLKKNELFYSLTLF